MLESIESRLWPVPVATTVVAVAIGIIFPRLDLLVDSELPTAVDSAVFNGGADTARSVLSSIAGSLITATSLTFSLTVVALQLASSQASPRVLRLFARDRQVHWTLAAFLGTFAYSITVLRSVRSAADEIPEFVPRISVTIAFVLTLVSVVMLVFFLAHLATQLRVETMLKDIHATTDSTIDLVSRRNEAAASAPLPAAMPADKHTVTSGESGFITGHDHELLVRIASEHAIIIEEIRHVGDNLVAGTPLARWWPRDEQAVENNSDDLEGRIRSAYSIGYERTSAQDIDFGIQQILDIGVRALSAGVNDPTTAAHALGHLSALTAHAVNIPPLPAGLASDNGELCVITVDLSAAERINAALTPMRHYCVDHPAVITRFVEAADELSFLCRKTEVDAALLAQLDALARQLSGADSDPASTAAALASVSAAKATIAARTTRTHHSR